MADICDWFSWLHWLNGKSSSIDTQKRIFQFASAFQILLGIIAAISIFLDKLIISSCDAMILQVLFLLGITIGLWELSRVSQMHNS